jgi:hypothetical protein
MSRRLALSVVALTACQAVTGGFSVGTGDSGPNADDSSSTGDDAVDGASVTGTFDATPDGTPDAPPTMPDAAAEAGLPEAAAEAGPACLSTLSGIGTGDFRISFTLTTTNTTLTLALVNQRANCACTGASNCSSPSTFWDVVVDSSGGIIATTDDGSGASYVDVEAGNSVNDGKAHQIVIARTAGMLTYSSDGVVHSSEVADAYSFGAFPSLTIGSDVCSTTTPLTGHGTLTDLCITTP